VRSVTFATTVSAAQSRWTSESNSDGFCLLCLSRDGTANKLWSECMSVCLGERVEISASYAIM